MDSQNQGSKRTAAAGKSKIATKSQETAEQWKEAVVGQVDQVRERAKDAKEHTTGRIRTVADQMRSMSDSLREQDPMVADIAQRASQSIDGIARYVGEATPQSIIRDTERIARRQPALFYGAAFLLGLAAGRFIKGAQLQLDGDEDGERSDRNEYTRNGSWQGERSSSGAQTRERQSGFYSSPAQETRTTERYQENYDAAFGHDGDDRLEPETSASSAGSRQATSASDVGGAQKGTS
jgi:hypothetical protein